MAGTRDFENLRFWKNVRVPFFKNPQKMRFLKMPPLPGSEIPLLAIHKILSHIWEDGSRKVNNDKPDLRFFHGNFWPVISHAVRKPCFSASIPRGQNLPSQARNTKGYLWAAPIWPDGEWNTKGYFWASPIWQGSKRKAKGRQGKRNTKWHLWASKVPAFGGWFRGPAYI